jgi:FKBP-type peptidyl-prolyl cis-trans isomerase 2
MHIANRLFKLIRWPVTAIFMTLALASYCAASGADDAPPPGAEPVEAKISDYDQLRQVMHQAIEDAKAKGEKHVYIHLQEDPDIVQPADLVAVDYTVTDPQGRNIYSTRPEIYSRMDERYADLFGQAGTATGTETVLAGYSGIFPGSGHAVLGLRRGEQRTVRVPPDKGFGPRDEDKIKQYARQRALPKTAVLTVDAFLERFGTAPESGKTVNLSPYFHSRVTGVADGIVHFENVVDEGKLIEDVFGKTVVTIEADRIIASLDPTVGAPFIADDKKGVVSGKDDTHFFVDYNHPLAGQDLTFDVTVKDLEKFSVFENIEIPWIEDHDTAMNQAATAGKPLVLVLYADWCTWSQRLMTYTFTDPRIKRYHDRFVWLKIDSDKERVYKEVFGQDGFPMIVLMDETGEEIEKIDGFRDGGALSLALESVLFGKKIRQIKAQSAEHADKPSGGKTIN